MMLPPLPHAVCRKISLLLIVLLFAANVSAEQPALFIQEPIKDMGVVDKGELTEQVFILENRGSGPLRIEKYTASCACSKVTAPEPIQPGQSGNLVVGIKTADVGSREISVELETNDPGHAKVVLQVSCRVVESIYANPEIIQIGPVDVHAVQSIPDCAIRAVWPEDAFHVTSISTSTKGVHVQTASALPQEDAIEHGIPLELAFDEPGTIRGFLSVHTNSKKLPIIQIPFSATITDHYITTPQEHFLGVLQAGEPVQYAFQIARNDGVLFHLTAKESAMWNVALEPVEPKTTDVGETCAVIWDVKLSSKSAVKAGCFQSELLLDTTDANGKEQPLRPRFNGYARAPRSADTL